MSYFGSDDVGFCILSGFDLLNNLTDINDFAEATFEETHTLGDSWVEQSPVGIAKFEVAINGFYDDGDNLSVEALVGSSGSTGGKIGSTSVLTWAPEGNIVGQPFRGGVIVQKNVQRLPSRGALHKIAGTLVGSGPAEDGIILKAYAASTGSTGNTQATSFDGGSSSTKGGAGYFQLSSLTLPAASTAMTAYIRHSVDDTTWVDLITFTASSAAVHQAGQRVATAASTTPVQRYLAGAWATSDTAADSTFTFTGMLGFVRTR